MLRIILAALGLLAFCSVAHAQIVGGPRPACTAFGTTAGTCIQGPGILGDATGSGLTLNSGTKMLTYVSGTWTPGISFNGSSTGITYSVQAGNYTKVGRVCTVAIRLVLTAKGAATGPAKVTGLPAACTSISGAASGGAVGVPLLALNFTLTGAIPLVSTLSTGSATTLDLQAQSTATAAITDVTDASFANNTELYFTATFLSNSE